MMEANESGSSAISVLEHRKVMTLVSKDYNMHPMLYGIQSLYEIRLQEIQDLSSLNAFTGEWRYKITSSATGTQLIISIFGLS